MIITENIDCDNYSFYCFQGCFTKASKRHHLNLLSVGSESGHPAAFTAFFLFSCPHLKKCAKHPQTSPLLIYTFFQILYTYFISIKTLNSAEDIFLSQKKVIAEIIHGFCHDLRTVTIQYGYPQDVIGKLPDQRQIVL